MNAGMIAADDQHAQIRAEVRKLCAKFPGEYWRKLDRDAAYPSEFVTALADAGYLSALIPEEYGGSGLPFSAAAAILEEVQRAGCNGAACHAQMYIIERKFRETRLYQVAPISTNLILSYLAEHTLGLPRSY